MSQSINLQYVSNNPPPCQMTWSFEKHEQFLLNHKSVDDVIQLPFTEKSQVIWAGKTYKITKSSYSCTVTASGIFQQWMCPSTTQQMKEPSNYCLHYEIITNPRICSFICRIKKEDQIWNPATLYDFPSFYIFLYICLLSQIKPEKLISRSYVNTIFQSG